jgi:ribosomal protein S18 acetylase RimI-like enzyme
MHDIDQRLSLSPELRGANLALRPQTDADEPFLKELYTSARWPELASTGWPDGLKQAFLEQQRTLQTRHYVVHYEGLWRGIVVRSGEAIGRIYLWQNGNDLRIVDLSLLAAHRNRGIGTRLLHAIISEATSSNTHLSLHVEQGNPARFLYQRQGFNYEGTGAPPYLRMVYRSGCPQNGLLF